MKHKTGRIDKGKLKKMWNAGKSAKDIADEMKVSYSAVSQMVNKLGLKNKSKRIQEGVELTVARRVLYDSEKLYREGIDMVALAKKTLARLDAIVEINWKEIESAKGKKVSKKTSFQQGQVLKAIYNLSNTMKTLISYEETLLNIHQYQIIKNAVITAAERVSPEMKEMLVAELRKEELNVRHLFGTGSYAKHESDDTDE